MIRKVNNYKYLDGSLVEYALFKEKLHFQVELKCTEVSSKNLIVMALPVETHKKIDRETIITVLDLFRELRKL